jgi:glycosyltransferase involved in cell wall biosynthesis
MLSLHACSRDRIHGTTDLWIYFPSDKRRWLLLFIGLYVHIFFKRKVRIERKNRKRMVDISIVTPTYNRSTLLPRAWLSIKDQKANFQWVIADDGSSDDTKDVVDGFKDTRIVYLRFRDNRGVNAVRNAGAALALGRYVVFLDSDDELCPDALRSMIGVMDDANDDIGVALFPCVIAATGKQNVQVADGKVLDERDILCHGVLRRGEMIYVYRREVFDHFLLPEGLRGCEQVFVYEISKRFNFLAVNKPLRVIHRQSDNLSNAETTIARSRDIARSYEMILENHKDILKHDPFSTAQYLKKALYRYGVARSYRHVWRIYTRLIHKESSLQKRVEATAMLVVCLVLSTFLERWRINRLNNQFMDVR